MILDQEKISCKKKYKLKVNSITKTSIKQNDIIIPEGYEVDHIFPVSYGHQLGLPPHVIGHINNLQIITREENRKKSNKCDSIPIFIQQYMLGITKEELDSRKMYNQQIGIEIAKLKGLYRGRSTGTKESSESFLKKTKNQEIIQYLSSGYTQREIVKLLNCSFSTVNKVKKLMSKSN